MRINGLTVLIVAVACALLVAGIWAFVTGWVMDRPEPRHAAARDEQDTLAWLMTIKYGPAWGALAVRDRLMFLRAIIAAAGGTFQASPAGPPSAPSPSVADGAAREGTPAAAGSVPAPQALPPLPPEEANPGERNRPRNLRRVPAAPERTHEALPGMPPGRGGLHAELPGIQAGGQDSQVQRQPPLPGIGTGLAAIGTLPPDELGPECSYQPGRPFTDWLRDDIAMEAAP